MVSRFDACLPKTALLADMDMHNWRRDDMLPHPEALEDQAAAVRQRNGARVGLRPTGRLGVDHAHRMTTLMQGQCGSEADRAGADNQNRWMGHSFIARPTTNAAIRHASTLRYRRCCAGSLR